MGKFLKKKNHFINIVLGASFIIKKKALVQISLGSGRRAANGGYGYLTNWLWWFGLSLSKLYVLI